MLKVILSNFDHYFEEAQRRSLDVTLGLFVYYEYNLYNQY